MQWILKSIGAMIGSSISLSLSIDQKKPVGVSTPVYITFIVIHSSAIFIALFFIVNPKKVVREDGTHIAIFKPAKFWPELKGTVAVMCDYKYLLTAPAQLVCEMALALVSSVNCTTISIFLHLRKPTNVSSQVFQPAHTLRQQLRLPSHAGLRPRHTGPHPRRQIRPVT